MPRTVDVYTQVDAERIGSNINKARLKKGWTPGVLAVKIGSTKNQLGRWEIGESVPPFKIHALICEVLGLPESTFEYGKKQETEEHLERG